jgi:branched-chain amino acid aminotransferase
MTMSDINAGSPSAGQARQSVTDIKKVWMDGELVEYAQATIPILSHSLHYGTAAFEGIRAYAGHDGRTYIFRGREHFQRLLDSIKVLGTQCQYTVDDLLDATRQTIRANGLKECYVRPIAYFGDSHRGLKLPPNASIQLAILTWAWGKYMGDEGQQKGIRVMVCSYRRPDISTALPWAKLSGAYLYSVMARRQASNSGMDESILLDPQGFVAEGSGENLFVVKNGALTTPLHSNILPGITRDSIIQIAKSMGHCVVEAPVIRNQLYIADELFFTGTAVEVNAIREVDNYAVGNASPGPITRKLSDAFFDVVRARNAKFAHWLDPV